MFPVKAKQTFSTVTRDGVRLDADVYVPQKAGTFPVLLMRQPYGRAIGSTVVYAHPSWYAAHGYIVVIQDVRGRGTSEGDFHLFSHEVEDGADTVEWAASLPQSNGQVGMYGFSYQGMTQLYAAQAQPKALKTIAPAMSGYFLYEDWAYENGAFCLHLALTWAIQLAAETARLKNRPDEYEKLLAAASALPTGEAKPTCPEILQGIDTFFHDWVANPHSNAYWEALTPQLQNVSLPMLHIGGWFDPYLRGDLRLHQEMVNRCPAEQHPLWVGPWCHIPWGRKAGTIDFGDIAISPVDRIQIQWFNHTLKGADWPSLPATPGNAAIESSNIWLFEMGRNQWRGLINWPPDACQGYLLVSEGLSHIREDSQLVPEPAATSSRYRRVWDHIVHDPWNPVPARGGHSTIPGGIFDRTDIDSRGDVLTYTSYPFPAEIRVAGVCKLLCEISTAAISYDLCAVLSRVSGGKVYNLTQGYTRVDHPEKAIIRLSLHPTCFSLGKGEAIRLSLSASCFPAYPINPGTGASLADSHRINAQIISLAIATGQDARSRLYLPIVG